jgi:glycosyltransferase involved in cell wall biosynthesis
MNSDDVLFVGLGATAVCYYRILLPATALGADYIGVRSEPPSLRWATGLVAGQSCVIPDFSDYKVVVVQQPHGEGWLNAIKQLQARGVTVLAESDDFIAGVGQIKSHDYRQAFDQEFLASHQACLRAADGIIVSTEFLAKAYRPLNKRSWVCRNGIDPARYAYELPAREACHFGWAGATGHTEAAMPWMQATALAMAARPQTCFVSIGQPFADGFKVHFGESRAVSVPFCAIEQYPAAMTHMDVALGPAGKENFFKAKSDLRWLEAGALGIPLVGHPAVYSQIRDGIDGFRAVSPERVKDLLVELADDRDLRTGIGASARERILTSRTIEHTVTDWEAPLGWAMSRS